MRKPAGHGGLKRITHLQTSFQIIRARHEEKVLVKNFPEYADYKKKVSWFGKNPFHKE
jgi:protein-S-isoprenylcysteine O-methyltransferase Ste14